MVFGFFEGSRFRGQPVHLVDIIIGNNDITYRFTDADRDITLAGNTYESTPIGIPNIRANQSTDTAEINISVPADGLIGSLFSFFPPSQVVDIIIRQGHVNDPDVDFVVLWSGRVLAAVREGPQTKLKVGSLLRSLKRVGLARHYQLACPWALYGPNCRADRLSKQVDATLNTVSAVTITVQPGSLPFPDSKYLGGEAHWTNASGPQIRSIVATPAPNEFLLSGPTSGLLPGSIVRMYAGCAHNIDDCQNFHNNILNYGGQPNLPLKNVVNKNNHWG